VALETLPPIVPTFKETASSKSLAPIDEDGIPFGLAKSLVLEKAILGVSIAANFHKLQTPSNSKIMQVHNSW
jgi:hypothetical protein